MKVHLQPQKDSDIEEAWQEWATKVIYRNYPANYAFPAAGSHYEAFKAGWEAAKQEG